MGFTAFQRLTASALNALVNNRKLVARAQRDTNSSTTTTTESPVMRLDDVVVPGAGVPLIIMTNSLLLVGNNGDGVGARLRYTTDGSTPTITSTELGGGLVQTLTAQGSANTVIVGKYIPSSSSELLSVLLTVQRRQGTGNVFIDATIPMEILVLSMGDSDPGDTGVNL